MNMLAPQRRRLVIVGNGMAGIRTLEEILARAPQEFDVTVFGAEPHGNYNRIMLSPVLAAYPFRQVRSTLAMPSYGDKRRAGVLPGKPLFRLVNSGEALLVLVTLMRSISCITSCDDVDSAHPLGCACRGTCPRRWPSTPTRTIRRSSTCTSNVPC